MVIKPNAIDDVRKILVQWLVTHGDSWQPYVDLRRLCDSSKHVHAFQLVKAGMFECSESMTWAKITEEGKQWLQEN